LGENQLVGIGLLSAEFFFPQLQGKMQKKAELRNVLLLFSIKNLTLSLPTAPKIKIQNGSQISFCKILKYMYK